MCVQRREKLGLPPGDTDPALDDLSDSEYVIVEDPPELVAARERLAQYTARKDEQEPPGVCPRNLIDATLVAHPPVPRRTVSKGMLLVARRSGAIYL